MNKELFLRVVACLGEQQLGGFKCEIDSKMYTFIEDYEEGVDAGRHQYSKVHGILQEIDTEGREIERFNFGVSRGISRCGSDNSYWEESYEEYVAKEIVEVIIPEHTELKWVDIK
jgi:hypothetical protein